jgi:hypothetical protein
MSDDKLPWFGALMLAPLMALLIVGASALSVFTAASARLASGEAVGEFAARSAIAMDDLQRERANATNWLILGSPEARDMYETNWQNFERTKQNLFALFDTGNPHSAQFHPETRDALQLSLTEVEAVRADVMARTISVEQSMNAYTRALNHFIDVIGVELSRATGEQARFTGAFVALCRFHDRYAEELGAGLFAYAGGEISQASHRVLLRAIGAQDSHVAAFHSLADPHWDRELQGVINRADPDILDEARAHLIASGYGAPLDDTHRVWWRETRVGVYYELSTLRNRFAQEGVRAVLEETRTRRDDAVRNALIQLVLIVLAAMMAGFAAFRLLGVRPEPEADTPVEEPAPGAFEDGFESRRA